LGDVPPPGVFEEGEYADLRALAAREVGKGEASKWDDAKGARAGAWYVASEATDETGLATYVTEASIAVAAGAAVIIVLRARRRKSPPPVAGR
jgi:hypothetical protein